MAADVLNGKAEQYRQDTLRWVRLLLEYGPMEHHRLPSRHLNLLQLYHLDIFLFTLSVPILFFSLLFFSHRLLLKMAPLIGKQKKL